MNTSLVEADPAGVGVAVQLGQQELVLADVVDRGQIAALVQEEENQVRALIPCDST